MQIKKYKISEEPELVKVTLTDKKNLYRIIACKDIDSIGVRNGDLGGYVESEKNLNQEGDCWLFDNSKSFENAFVSGSALLFDESKVAGNTFITENAQIRGDATIVGNAKVFGNSRIIGSFINGDYRIYGNTTIQEDISLLGFGDISGNVNLSGFIQFYGKTVLFGNIKTESDGKIFNGRKQPLCFVREINTNDQTLINYNIMREEGKF